MWAPARTAHKGLRQKRMVKDLCWIVPPVPPTTRSVNGLNWTELPLHWDCLAFPALFASLARILCKPQFASLERILCKSQFASLERILCRSQCPFSLLLIGSTNKTLAKARHGICIRPYRCCIVLGVLFVCLFCARYFTLLAAVVTGLQQYHIKFDVQGCRINFCSIVNLDKCKMVVFRKGVLFCAENKFWVTQD